MLAAELEDFFVANKGPRTVITKETADATVAQLLEETTAYPPRSKRTTRIQKEIRSNRATQIAKQAAVNRLAAQVREQLEEWRRIGAGPQLLHWIAKGVAIKFTNGPPPSYDLGASLTSMTEDHDW
ncbi:hypothetical protein PPROV_001088100 [Pycnococcus provasolii]|uniref:Uncharacterized protein n=1 Tax=Pycnococcus provasolii TaxID=41880 RepID=A0A830HZF7_9CHLO|nr:hypothetical protein PPROV_001088100 [Pycnococcus provasolii]